MMYNMSLSIQVQPISTGGQSPYVPPVLGHGQFLDQISVKTYVGTPSFYCEMCPRKMLGHAQFQKRDYTAANYVHTPSMVDFLVGTSSTYSNFPTRQI